MAQAITNGNAVAELLPKRWFCAAIGPTGTISRRESEVATDLEQVCASASLAWVDFWTEDFERDALNAAIQFGFSQALIASLTGESPATYQDFDIEMGVRLPSINVVHFDVQAYPLVIMLRKGLVLSIHPLSIDRRFSRLRRYSDSVLRKIPDEILPEDKLTLLLMRLIDENNDRNFEDLRRIEERGDKLSEDLVNPRTSRDKLGLEIYEMKHALISYLNSLWETVDVLHALRYGDAELLTNDNDMLNKMTVLADDVGRHIGLSEHMSEVLASGLEVLQSIYNNQLQALNNRLALVMTYLTIVGTAVLVPNTLATILSNTAFDLGPQDRGWYIILLAVSTVFSTLLAWFWVRKRGWLPRRVD